LKNGIGAPPLANSATGGDIGYLVPAWPVSLRAAFSTPLAAWARRPGQPPFIDFREPLLAIRKPSGEASGGAFVKPFVAPIVCYW
jgi:hypothetical protein